jgi:hypothetical protein
VSRCDRRAVEELAWRVDQVEVKKDWAVRGFSCGLWGDPPYRIWKNLVHDIDELVILVEGEEEFESFTVGLKRRKPI